MRDFIPAIGIARASLIYYYNGQVCQNVLHYKTSLPYTVETMTDLAVGLKGWWNDELKGYMTEDNKLARIEIQALDWQNSPGIVYTDGLPSAGVNITDVQEPGNVTLAIKWTTANRGKWHRGRTYHVGLLHSHVTGNTVTGLVAIALYTSYVKLLHPPYTVGDHYLQIVSYREFNVWRTNAVCTPVTACVVDDHIDSQRRRLYGRGK